MRALTPSPAHGPRSRVRGMRSALGVAMLSAIGALAHAEASAGCAPPGRAWISEVFYDATGDDTGFEFVELANPTGTPVPLAGARLEAGDGAAPGRWTLRWTGGATDTVRSHARFVIGGARVSPAPDALVTLELQNGPDAVRLVWPDGVVEVVGYGALADSGYYCGSPAPDVPSGSSLARIPDDADTGSDARDLRPASPTPGRANQPARDLAMVPGSLALAPAHPAAGQPVTLGGRVVSRGRDDLGEGAALVSAGWLAGADTAWAASAALPAIAAGDTVVFALTLAPPSGKVAFLARVNLPGDETATDDLDTLRARVGPGPLALTEVQFHPLDDAGEWIEVQAWDTGAVAAAGFKLHDRGGTVATARGGRGLSPGERAVLAQRRDAFVAAHPTLDSSRVLAASPWPSLNNTDGADGIADVVALAEPDGTPSDALAYSASGVPAGVPLERLDDTHWSPSRVSGGTPLAPPLAPPSLARRFEARPARLTAGGGRARLAWDLPWGWVWLDVRAFDLAGRDAGPVLSRALRAGHTEAEWDPAPLPAGVYLLVLTAEPESGGAPVSETTAVRIVRRVP